MEDAEEVNFDTSLPSNHPYPTQMWGEGEETRALSDPSFDSGTILELPLWRRKDVLFPSEQTPLSGTGEDMHYLENLGLFSTDKSSKVKALGVVASQQNGLQEKINEIGVTVQVIYSKCQRNPENLNIERFSMLVQGKQRFRIIQVIHNPMELSMFRNLIWAKVEILNDGPTESPRPLMNFSLKQVTSLPYWIHAKYSPVILLEKLISLSPLVLPVDKIPKDPDEASFWIGRNLVLSIADRLELLEMSTPIRLLKEIEILEKYTIVCCRECERTLANTKHIFSLSNDGPQSAFINEYGYVHSTITFRRVVENPLLYGNPSTENSWFPGYAWIIALCPSCGGHIGWKFVKTQSHLSPSSFWGLSRNSITRKIE